MENLRHLFTPEAVKLACILTTHEISMRLVGGAVRDALMGLDPKDLDFAVDAPPEKVMDVLESEGIKVVPTGLKHGTITAVVKGIPHELTTLRVDVKTDGRRAQVAWTDDWKVDAARRDLTINAMSVDVAGNLHDFFGGQKDLKNKVVRFIGNAEQRIIEDHLRILRFFRFKQHVGSTNTDSEAFNAIRKHADSLKNISGERIWSEMSRILPGKLSGHVLTLMGMTGVMDAIGIENFHNLKPSLVDGFTKNPITLLVSGIDWTKWEPIRSTLVDRWKVSIEERQLFDFLVRNFKILDSEHHFPFLQVLATTPKVKRVWVEEMATLFQRPDLVQQFKEWPTPKFPVTGQNLLDTGMKPGPAIGTRMNLMHQAWVSSGFMMDKEELLKVPTN